MFSYNPTKKQAHGSLIIKQPRIIKRTKKKKERETKTKSKEALLGNIIKHGNIIED